LLELYILKNDRLISFWYFIHFNLEEGPTIKALVHIFEWKVSFYEKLKIPYMGLPKTFKKPKL